MEGCKISWIIDTSRSLMGFNRALRTRFEELEAKEKKLSECEHYMEEVSRHVRQPNRRYDEPGSAYKFRTGTFLVIIDSIDGELQKRLVTHTGIAKRFGFLQKLKDLPDDQVFTSAQSLQEPYTTGLEASLSNELLQPSGFPNMEPAKKSLDGCNCLSSYSCSFSSHSFGRDVRSW